MLKDYESWMSIVSDGRVRKEKGSKGLNVYRSARNPNEVYIVVEWDDNKSYLDYLNLPDVQKSLAETGTTELIEVSDSFHLEA